MTHKSNSWVRADTQIIPRVKCWRCGWYNNAVGTSGGRPRRCKRCGSILRPTRTSFKTMLLANLSVKQATTITKEESLDAKK